MKRILVIGSGGREHAIVWALRQTSPVPLELFCAPGNAGIGQLAQLVNVSVNDQQELAAFAESNSIDLTFVGPEAPLTAGIVDAFDARGLAVVGPPAAAARLEGSKIFAKEFMLRREGKVFREMIFNKLTGRENGNSRIEWSKVWKLTKMAAKMYFDSV